MCICSLYMRRKSAKPGHGVLVEVHHPISDLGDDIVLESCQRVKQMSTYTLFSGGILRLFVFRRLNRVAGVFNACGRFIVFRFRSGSSNL